MSGADYFTFTNLVAATLARSSDVNSRMASIQGAFGKLPHYEKLQQGRSTYVVDSGDANMMIVTLDFAPASYVDGLELTVKVNAANTGPATVNVNGLGAKTVKRSDGSSLISGDLAAGRIVHLLYDGTNFQLLGASESAAAASATAAAAYATAAQGYRDQASTYATAAAASAAAAAVSATNSANSATAAAASAVAAAAAVSGYVAKAGDTMLGLLTLSGAPTANLHAATKKYVDDAVFAAGAYTADGVSITLSTGQFSLTTIATNRLMGNNSGSTAKPGALTPTQVTAMLDTATTSLKGLLSSADKTKLDAITGTNTGDQTSVSGNAGTATALQTGRTIAISGAVTGTATSFNGTANITIPITALDVGAATTGTLAVARGGTGVVTATGSGSVVLSSAPTMTNPVVGTQAAGDSSTKAASTAFVQGELAAYSKALLTITPISADRTLADADNNTLLQCTGSTPRTLTAGTIATGVSLLIAVTGSAAWTFACAGGVYLAGTTATVPSATIPGGSQCVAIHLGSGVWLLSGT